MADVTITTIVEAIAHADEWERIARDQAREIYMLHTALDTYRAELHAYKSGYKLAMELAKPAPKFEQETEPA